MFSSKNKITTEDIQALINKSNSSILERINILEQQNHQLTLNNQFFVQKINYLENTLQDMHQKLERRITDFTDVWHPFMTSNINRIKDELIEIVQNEIKASHKLQEPNKELEQKLDILQNKFDNTNIEGNIVIGIQYVTRLRSPIIHKTYLHQNFKDNPDYQSPQIIFFDKYLQNKQKIFFTLKSFKCLTNIYKFTKFNLNGYPCNYIDENDMDFELFTTQDQQYNTFLIDNVNGFPRYGIKKNLKKCLNILDECNIKLLYNNSDLINGIPIRELILS